MSNRKFWGLEEGRICLCTTEMEDRDILELKAIPHDRDEGKITEINRVNKTIRREGNDNLLPFPDKFYTKSDIERMRWEVCRVGVFKCAGHEGH